MPSPTSPGDVADGRRVVGGEEAGAVTDDGLLLALVVGGLSQARARRDAVVRGPLGRPRAPPQRRLEAGLTAARVQKIRTVASVAFRAAVRRDLIAASPTLMTQVPSVGRQEPKAPSVEEVGLSLAAAADDPDLRAILVVAANTVSRRAEVCALRWCDVNLSSRTMTISKSVTKGAGTGAVIRQTKTGVVGQVAVSDQVVSVLSALLERRQEAAGSAG